MLGAVWTATATAADDRYRVELIVFRNLEVPATPVEMDTVRRFRSALELDDTQAPETPVRLDKRDGAFANLWTRLERLAEYEPLLRLTFEQSLYDYHPPVRVHDDVVLGQALHFPNGLAYLNLPETGNGAGWFDDYVESLYRLDGTLQLRRSRFLHVDLDLEYRIDGPAWTEAFPARLPLRLPEGFEWLGGQPRTGPAPDPAADAQLADAPPEADARPAAEAFDDTSPEPLSEALAEPLVEPFRLYRLQQSRQVRTGTMQYFDSAFLGAIVRVTTIADAP